MARKFSSMKRLLSMFLTMTLMMGCLSTVVFADEELDEDYDEDFDFFEYLQGLESNRDESYVYELKDHVMDAGLEIRNAVTGTGGSETKIFDLVNEEGEHFSGYCIDESTPAMTNSGMKYTRENLEDAVRINGDGEWVRYYTDEQAASIRAILTNGYQGSDESLAALAEKIQNESLTAEEALAGTQWAIWNNSNASDEYSKYDGRYPVTPAPAGSEKLTGEVEEAFADSKARIEAVHDYLVNLPGIEPSASDETVLINSEKLAASNITEKLAEDAAEELAKDLDTEAMAEMQAGDRALQTSDDAAYLITRNEDGTFTVEVSFDLNPYGDLSGLKLEVTNNETSVLETDLNKDAENENSKWTILQGIGTLLSKVKEAVNNLSMKISGTQETEAGYYVYQSESRFPEIIDFEPEEGDDEAEDEFEVSYVPTYTSQNFVGWTDKGTEKVSASLTLVINLPEIEEPETPETPEEPETETETPEEPETEIPEEPETETPEEPETETPEDPKTETPKDPEPETPKDPETETPKDPKPEPPEEKPEKDDTPVSVRPERNEPAEETPKAEEQPETELPAEDPNVSAEDPAEEPEIPAETPEIEVLEKESVPAGDKILAEEPAEEVTSSGNLPQTGAIAHQSSLHLAFFGASAVMAALAAALWLSMTCRKEN